MFNYFNSSVKILLINTLTYWQTVKAVSECFPQFNVVSPFTLIIETINSARRPTLEISLQQCNNGILPGE